MERDFMGLGLGLNLKGETIPIKREADEVESPKDSGMQQWSSTSKVSAVPRTISFKTDHSPFKAATMSSADSYERNKKRQYTGLQLGIGESKLYEESKMKKPFVQRVPVTTTPPPPRRYQPYSSKFPELTIIYAGKIHVFDKILPHQVEAVLTKARTVKYDKPLDKYVTLMDQVVYTSEPGTPYPVPMVRLPGTTPTTGVPPPSPAPSDSTIDSDVTSSDSAVPQARKASLTRFFEKRKERVVRYAPYNRSRQLVYGIGDVEFPNFESMFAQNGSNGPNMNRPT